MVVSFRAISEMLQAHGFARRSLKELKEKVFPRDTSTHLKEILNRDEAYEMLDLFENKAIEISADYAIFCNHDYYPVIVLERNDGMDEIEFCALYHKLRKFVPKKAFLDLFTEQCNGMIGGNDEADKSFKKLMDILPHILEETENGGESPE